MLATLLSASALGQSDSPASKPNSSGADVVLPGIVVEAAGGCIPRAKLVLQKGDILLSWSRGGTDGDFESPASLWWLFVEQRRQEAVTVRGLRGNVTETWVLGSNDFCIKTRPNFTSGWLAKYTQAQRLAEAGKTLQAADQWAAMAQSVRGTRWLASWICAHAANILAEHQLWKRASEAFAEAIRLADDELSLSTPTQSWWGLSLWQGGELAQANEHYQKGLAGLQKSGHDTLAAAEFLNSLSADAIYETHLQQARDYAVQALAIVEKLGPDSRQSAQAQANLGWVAYGSGDLDEAEKRLSAALQAYRELAPDSCDVARILADLASVVRARSDLAKADIYLNEALAIQTRLGAAPSAALQGLGDTAWGRGDLPRAEWFYRRSIEIDKKNWPLSPFTVFELINLGAIYLEDGNFEQANHYVWQGWLIARRTDPRGVWSAFALGFLGRIALARGQLNLAERYLLQSLSIEKGIEENALLGTDVAQRLEQLGELAKKRRRLKEARAYYAQALAMLAKMFPDGIEYAEGLAAMADILHMEGNLDEAARALDRALTTLEGHTANIGGNAEARADFRSKHEKYYRQYVDLLMRLDTPERAFEVLERSRARTLLETLATAHIDVRQGADPDVLAKERSLQADLKAKSERRVQLLSSKHNDEELKRVEKEISSLTADYADVESQLREGSPGYAALTQPKPLGTKDIQEQLVDQDTVLLEYSLSEDRSFVFAVTPDSLQAFVLPKRLQIQSSARRVYDLITARNRVIKDETPVERQERWRKAEAGYAQASRALSRMILGPVAKQLGARFWNKRLLVVTDGALAYIPFGMLPDPQTPEAPPKQADTPLMVNHEIVNLPSASVLAVLRHQQMARPAAPKAVAVLADPVFDKHDSRIRGLRGPHATSAPRQTMASVMPSAFFGSLSSALLTRSVSDVGLARRGAALLPRLRYSRQEADAIMAVTPSGAGMEALDFGANRTTAISPDLSHYRVVHFSTHGLLDSGHPELSGLVLSLVDENGNPQDGFLGLQDIYNLNLPADLVVLSACETGLGKEINGEGVIGLTRGFMYAGATRVVASLWKVSDVATAKLMAGFYQFMEKDGLRPAAALRAAQIAMWKQTRWQSPYHWAAFQIQGEWK